MKKPIERGDRVRRRHGSRQVLHVTNVDDDRDEIEVAWSFTNPRTGRTSMQFETLPKNSVVRTCR